MPITVSIPIFVIALLLSGVFATLTYSLRDFSRARLADILERRGMNTWLDRTIGHAGELAFLTAALRLICNLTVLLILMDVLRDRQWNRWLEYTAGVGIALVLSLFVSIAIPHALAQHVAEPIIALFVRPLNLLRVMFQPLLRLLRLTENVVASAASGIDESSHDKANTELQSEIMAVMDEGEKEGVVDETEREMIESVMEFGDATVGPVMTARPNIVSLPCDAPLERVRSIIEDSVHSRIPVYENTLDHVIGVLYARDLLKYVGETAIAFNVREAMRQPFFVPESKLLRDLLQDFRLQKVHIAIVLDEYGGTAGLITIEDVLEQLVGDISDEHEAIEPAVFKRIDDQSAEVDARIPLDELNRMLGTRLPEDADYDTLGGFVSTHLGRIPQAGTEFEYDNAAYSVLAAEPQRVSRVKIQLLPQNANASSNA
ncbi:MAG: hemolysin family protein [Tepidisphaeraceae bacterium]